MIAGVVAGRTAVCYADLASAVPASVSACSDPCPTRHEVVAMRFPARLLPEYGVSTAAVALGWSQYVNKCWTRVRHRAAPCLLCQARELAIVTGQRRSGRVLRHGPPDETATTSPTSPARPQRASRVAAGIALLVEALTVYCQAQETTVHIEGAQVTRIMPSTACSAAP